MVADGKRLSFSSTVGSPACCTSFITYFLLLTLEQCLSVELMVKSGVPTNIHSLDSVTLHTFMRRFNNALSPCASVGKQEELQGFQSLLDSGLGGSGKRQRGANAAQPFLPLRESLAELEDVPQWLHDYGVTEEMIDNMTMRCDVWVCCPCSCFLQLRLLLNFPLRPVTSRLNAVARRSYGPNGQFWGLVGGGCAGERATA